MTHTDLRAVIFWMTGALLSFCGMAVSIRALAERLNIFEILAIRNGSGLAILLALALVRPELRAAFGWHRLDLHLLRNSVHYAAQYAWALSLTLLPLATVFSLEFTMPAWATLLAVIFLGERLTVSRAGAIVLGFLGVLVILRPGLEAFKPAALLVLGAAFGFAVTLTTTKRLTGLVSTFAILFWMNLIQLPMALIGGDPLFALKLGAAQLPGVIGISVAGLASHYCLANAFRAGDAIVVVPIDFLRMPLIALVGWLFYREPLDLVVFAGAGLIILGILWNLTAEHRRTSTEHAGR